jgi:hypothetical protein
LAIVAVTVASVLAVVVAVAVSDPDANAVSVAVAVPHFTAVAHATGNVTVAVSPPVHDKDSTAGHVVEGSR